MLTAPVEGILQQVPSLGQLVALLIPELYLVDGDAHEVKAQLLQTGEVVLLDMEKASLSKILRMVQDLWRQLSEFLKDRSCDWVAYEFMNEPVAPEHEQWNQLVAKVHKALRELEPQRTLVIGSNMWQGHETMKFLKVPEGDKNIILSFHYYNPMILTHYGAWWTPLGKYKGKVNYPGVLVSKEDFDAAPAEIKDQLKQYTEEVWNIDKIREQFKDAIEAAKKYDLQLFCGEWGVYEPVDRELAYNWYRDMLTVFDEFNIAWTTWCYDADFGFWDQQRHCYKDYPLVELLMSGKPLAK